MDLTPAASVPLPESSYRIAGEGRQLFSRGQIRDRIRAGDLSPHNELAAEGSEDFRPAESFPELARYFSLLSSAAPSAAVPTAPAAPQAGRVMAGLIYPFTGIGGIILVLAAILQSVPFGPFIAAAFTTVYTLAIIRASSTGSTTMPPLNELGGPLPFLISWLKAIGVTIGSAWPILVAIPLVFVLRSAAIPMIAAVVVVLYLPAAMAALARWNSLRLALTPSSMFRMMSILGLDYLIALVMGFVVLMAGAVSVGLLGSGLRRSSPLAYEALLTIIALWAIFYMYHLIGWAMYRHQHELE